MRFRSSSFHAVCVSIGVLLASLGVSTAAAQDDRFGTGNYYDYLPGAKPKRVSIVTATAASMDLGLYGDDGDGYTDADLNGIDDTRQEHLAVIAEMFSPVLRRNNFSVPRDFRSMLKLRFESETGQIHFDNRERLHVDTWDLSGPGSTNRHEAVIDVDCIRSRQTGTPDPVCPALCDECVLADLVADNDPFGLSRRYVRPDSATDSILYFDFQGNGERSWKQVYTRLEEVEQVAGGYDSRIYAHFLVHKNPDSTGDRKYRLVVQYWFFYPFNDGGNNHEGDWEHINVHLTTDDVREAFMTRDEIGEILNDAEAFDHLIIKEIDYYFHHFVLTLDFIDEVFDFYRMTIPEIRRLLDEMPQRENIRRWAIYRLMHDRVRLLEGCGVRWNRHPVGLIGANSRGPELLLRAPEESNRNSHGTYPFSGIWKQVGPFAATEELDEDHAAPFRKRTEYKFMLPEPERSQLGADHHCETSSDALLESEYAGVDNGQYLTYSRSEITLVPDWERLLPLMRDHESALVEWYWLVLPIRWGFPVIGSLGAGLLKDADLGNAAPVGPAYNTAWNRVGAARGYHRYDAHHLPAMWQIEVTDNFANKLGFLNAPVLALYLPGLNVLPFLWRAYRPRRKFTQTRPPSSFIDFQAGFGVHRLDDDFAGFVSSDLGEGTAAAFEREGERYWVRASTRLNWFESAVGYEWLTGASVVTAPGGPETDFRMGELFGDLTLRLSGASVTPFVLGGYGYRRVNYDGPSGTRGFGWNCRVESGLKNWISDVPSCFAPNVWHVGGGIDWMFHKNDDVAFLWNGHIPDMGLRFGYRATFERLPNEDWGTRHDFNAGLILGF